MVFIGEPRRCYKAVSTSHGLDRSSHFADDPLPQCQYKLTMSNGIVLTWRPMLAEMRASAAIPIDVDQLGSPRSLVGQLALPWPVAEWQDSQSYA